MTRRSKLLPDQNQTEIVIVGLIAITVLEITALLTHTDGQYMSLVVGAIAAIVGAVIGVKLTQDKAAGSVATA